MSVTGLQIFAAMCGAFSLGLAPWVIVRRVQGRWQAWPKRIQAEWLRAHPKRTAADFELCTRVLRQYFKVATQAPRSPTALPSAAADSVWHLLLTWKHYDRWCTWAYGETIPHIEKTAFKTPLDEALYRTFLRANQLTRTLKGIGRRPPDLFALDALLNWGDGFHYRYAPEGEAGLQLRDREAWVTLPWSVDLVPALAVPATPSAPRSAPAPRTPDVNARPSTRASDPRARRSDTDSDAVSDGLAGLLLATSVVGSSAPASSPAPSPAHPTTSSSHSSDSHSSHSHTDSSGHHDSGGSSCGSHGSSCGSNGSSCGSSCGGGGGD
jgi:hypothetical protein